jgi:cystathionine beta-synthase
LKRENYGDLRDLISRRHQEGATVTVGPADSLNIAYNRMKLYDVSQLPVIDGVKIVGFIDESDILLSIYGKEDNFKALVSSAMTKKVETISHTAQLNDLMPIFDKGHAAVVVDGDKFLGLITRIERCLRYPNYLRQVRNETCNDAFAVLFEPVAHHGCMR